MSACEEVCSPECFVICMEIKTRLYVSFLRIFSRFDPRSSSVFQLCLCLFGYFLLSFLRLHSRRPVKVCSILSAVSPFFPRSRAPANVSIVLPWRPSLFRDARSSLPIPRPHLAPSFPSVSPFLSPLFSPAFKKLPPANKQLQRNPGKRSHMTDSEQLSDESSDRRRS